MFDGILIIDKPSGITSHDVVARLRRILKTKSIGHTGTLDPFATGVMVMLVGKATRLARFLDKSEKEYEAVVRFGFETETGDGTGRPKGEIKSAEEFDLESIQRIIPKFRGEILQTPPMFSAKKLKGKKLYELARQGIEVEREQVRVFISTLEILAEPVVNWSDLSQTNVVDLEMKVAVSAGTYVRTLAEDIARAAGNLAHLSELRRTRAGQFTIDLAISIEDLARAAGNDEIRSHFISMNEAVSHLPKMDLSPEELQKTRTGLAVRCSADSLTAGEALRLVAPDGTLAAVGLYDAAENSVRPKVVFV